MTGKSESDSRAKGSTTPAPRTPIPPPSAIGSASRSSPRATRNTPWLRPGSRESPAGANDSRGIDAPEVETAGTIDRALASIAAASNAFPHKSPPILLAFVGRLSFLAQGGMDRERQIANALTLDRETDALRILSHIRLEALHPSLAIAPLASRTPRDWATRSRQASTSTIRRGDMV